MTSRLRIVQVVCTDAFAGVERYVTTLGRALAQDGCDVVVVGGDGKRMGPALAEAGAHWMANKSPVATLARLLRHRSSTDVVHAHMTQAELAAVLSSSFVHVPVVATRHFAQHRGSSPAARLVGRILTRRIAAQLAISQYVAQRTEGKSVVVVPGTPAPAALRRADEREQVVLVAQRLELEKRTDLAIRAWRESGLAAKGWRLWIAGDGRERCGLEALAASIGVDSSCDFIGVRRDIDALQQRASIVLAPRPDEPLGLSVIEAMAAGTPVVAAAGGGHLETVGQCPGAALYPPFEVAEAGRLLADLATDRLRRDSYGMALREVHGEFFSVERQVAQTLDVYRSVLA